MPGFCSIPLPGSVASNPCCELRSHFWPSRRLGGPWGRGCISAGAHVLGLLESARGANHQSSESLMMRHRPSPAWKKWTTRCRTKLRAPRPRREMARLAWIPGLPGSVPAAPLPPVNQTVRRPEETTSREEAGFWCARVLVAYGLVCNGRRGGSCAS